MTKPVAFLLCFMFSLFLTTVTANAQTPVPPAFAVLAGAGITNSGATTITGDVGSYPTLTQTGFSGANTVTMIGGTNHGGDGVTQGAKTTLVTAYGIAAGRGATTVPSELAGQALVPGVYDSAAGTFGITGTLTLTGIASDVFIFKMASTLITAAGAPGLPASVVVLNGIQPCNVFWQVGSSATLGTYSVFQGSILALTSITATTGATVNGRLLAQNGAVTLDTNRITASGCAGPPPPPPPPLTLACPANSGQALIAYSSLAVAAGGTPSYTFSVAAGALPAGLTLNISTGAITGTPTTAGPFTFVARVTDSLGVIATSASCGITIAAAPPPTPLSLTCAAVVTGQVGTLYLSALAGSGGTGPFTFGISSGALPAGLTLNSATGALIGTPTTAGQFTFTARVTDSLGATTASPTCGIAIAPVSPPTTSSTAPDLTITKSHAGNFQQGGSGAYTLTATNIGAGPTSGTVSVFDTLPAGLTAAAISGTGWSCVLSGLSCTRSDVLAAGAAYPSITVTVNVANNLLNNNPVGNGLTFQTGDILLSMKDGTLQWRRHDWTLFKTLTSGTDGQAKGMAFDASGNFFLTHYYGTGFSGNDVVKFDPSGNFIGTFGDGYNCNPASIVFDKAGNAYVGHADCSGNIFKFDSQGNSLAQYDVALENRGSSRILLGPDQCTMYYTSEGPNVKRFNVCTNMQMTDFNTAPLPDVSQGASQFALLPGGGLLIANFSVITRLDASGNFVRTYDAAGDTHCWLGMSLDPDGTSFWASNWCGSFATRFDMATGNVIESHVASETPFMIKQIMVVPPNLGSAVVINTATVSGGGEFNTSNNSASDSTTNDPTQPQADPQAPGQAPELSMASSAYCVGAAWNVAASNAMPNAPVPLMGTTNGQSWMVPAWATANASGRFIVGGAFTDGTQGSYTLKIASGGNMSNTIAFVVSDCKP